jgi:hypothetical protein
MEQFYIFIVSNDDDTTKTYYLTKDNTFSADFEDVHFMTEQEASDNCGNYSTDDFTGGCGSYVS